MRNDYLVFGKPHIEQDEINEVLNTLESGWIGTGPKVKKFEEEFKDYVGSKFAIAVASCTAGLHLSVLAEGISNGDEVLVPAMTFAATANAIIHSGAIPVLVDVDRNKMTIDINDIKHKITKKTKAIIPVHFAGRPCNMDEIQEVAVDNNITIINDAAHAIETEYNGRKIGNFPDVTNYSFYVTKNLTTAEGGMVTTNNEEIADRIKILALHGMSKDAWKRFSDDGYKHYEVIFPGYKYNMTDIQASLGLHQLKKIDENSSKREIIWNYYNKHLKDLPLILPAEIGNNIRHAYHLYTILIDSDRTNIIRDEVIAELHKRKIGTGVHYLAIHYHPYYRKKYGYKMGDFPNSEFISDRTLSLPLSPSMGKNDAEDVVKSLYKILS